MPMPIFCLAWFVESDQATEEADGQKRQVNQHQSMSPMVASMDGNYIPKRGMR